MKSEMGGAMIDTILPYNAGKGYRGALTAAVYNAIV